MNEGQFAVGVNLNQREVITTVDTEDFGFVLFFIGERDGDVLRAGDDVVVGDDLALIIDEKAGAGAFLGVDLEEEIALINHRGDVDGRQAVGLVDVDIVLFVGFKTGTVRGDWFRPQATAGGERAHELRESPLAA